MIAVHVSGVRGCSALDARVVFVTNPSKGIDSYPCSYGGTPISLRGCQVSRAGEFPGCVAGGVWVRGIASRFSCSGPS